MKRKRRSKKIDFSRGELINMRRLLNRAVECAEGRCPTEMSDQLVYSWYAKPILKKIKEALSQINDETEIERDIEGSVRKCERGQN